MKLRNTHAITATVRMNRSSEPVLSLSCVWDAAVRRVRREERGGIDRYVSMEARQVKQAGKWRPRHYVQP